MRRAIPTLGLALLGLATPARAQSACITPNCVLGDAPAVCKNMATHWDELAPVTTMEVVKLNDGIAMIHGVSDPAKVAKFHADCKLASTAGEATIAWSDEQAKTQLCEFCQEIRSAMKSGAKMSSGPTKLGDIMILTSSDPAVQTKLSALGDKCAAMSASM